MITRGSKARVGTTDRNQIIRSFADQGDELGLYPKHKKKPFGGFGQLMVTLSVVEKIYC